MNVRRYLKDRKNKTLRQIAFDGEKLDIAAPPARGHESPASPGYRHKNAHLLQQAKTWYTAGSIWYPDCSPLNPLPPTVLLDGPAMPDGIVTIPLPGMPIVCDLPHSDASAPATESAGGAGGSFVAGPENRLVDPAVRGVLDSDHVRYNPLVLYGPSGTGKSHLARGIAAAWRLRFPSSRIVYCTAIDFARELADAFEMQAVDDFRRRYREAGLAIFENIDELLGKKAAQEELIYTLDALLNQESQVVLTGSAMPGTMRGPCAGPAKPADGRSGGAVGPARPRRAAGDPGALGRPAAA